MGQPSQESQILTTSHDSGDKLNPAGDSRVKSLATVEHCSPIKRSHNSPKPGDQRSLRCRLESKRAYALISGANGSILRWDGNDSDSVEHWWIYPSTTIVRYVAWKQCRHKLSLWATPVARLSYDGTNLSALTSGTSNGLFSVTWSGSTATIVGQWDNACLFSWDFHTLATGVTSNLRGNILEPT